MYVYSTFCYIKFFRASGEAILGTQRYLDDANTILGTQRYFINALYKALYQSTLSKHLIKALYTSTLSKHFIQAPRLGLGDLFARESII